MSILLFKGTGLVSRLIRWQTRSVYSHAAILMPDGQVIESREGHGVRIVKLTPSELSKADRFSVEGMTPIQWQEAIGFCHRQLGRSYDWLAVLRFVSRRRVSANQRWFCSELVFAACQHAGVTLLSRIPASEVSPGDLALSPRLIQIEQ